MRLADDERGRVPFALIGVVLLLGSATYAATLAHRPSPAERPDAVAAMNRVDGVVATALHRGTKRAARASAGTPVLVPANTSGGGVLNDSSTFRDYLRVRIYLAVRADLLASAVEVGAVRVDPSLAATPDAAALRAAKRRVHLSRVDGGVRVHLENVTVELSRGGRVVDRTRLNVTRTVATPVLAVHERVEAYEERLNRGPAEGPGLGRRLTARTNAVAWIRGYAQYGGSPIENVLPNRHIELQTNAALLATQRATLGRSDPAGRRATTRATAIVGLKDVSPASRGAVDTVQAVPPARTRRTGPTAPPPEGPPRAPPEATEDVTVGVDLTADRAFGDFVDGRGDATLEGTVLDVYGASVRLVGAETIRASSRRRTTELDPDWTLVAERNTTSVTVHPLSAAGPEPSVPSGFHRLSTYTRRVVVSERTIQTWANGTGTDRRLFRSTVTTARTLYVTLAAVGRHASTDRAPARPIATVHERGGPLDGPNLQGVGGGAHERLVETYGSVDAAVERYVVGGLPDEGFQIRGERPAGLRDWLYADLAALRDRVRALSVTVSRRKLGAGAVNPAALLAERLRARRDSLVDAPSTYGSVAGKARVAARRAFLSLVLDRLQGRAQRTRSTRTAFEDELSAFGVDSDTLAASLSTDGETTRPPTRPVATGGPVGSLNATVAGDPPYLTLSAVTHRRARAVPVGHRYHPLVARNVNVFTAPYGDAADGIVSQLPVGSERTNLRSAARTLRSANASLAGRHDPELARRRDRLQSAVSEKLSYVRGRLRATLADSSNLSAAARSAAVREGLHRWNTTAARGLAAANGSLATAVAAAAVERMASPSFRRRDRMTVALRTALARAREDNRARPEQRVVDRAATEARAVTKEAIAFALEEGASRAAEKVGSRLDRDVVWPPAGLPIAPVPGYWYATTNVWVVDVRGAYARFAVTVPTAAPNRSLTYEREREVVRLDWDGDGRPERLGRSTRLSFAVSTVSIVVVPPGGAGVGDRDGNADERSAGWPRPGNATGK